MRALHVAILALAACSIPDTKFSPSLDGATGDGTAGTIAIRPSSTSVAVDEGGMATFTVQLTQPPAAEVRVTVALGAQADATAIAIQETQLVFLPETYDQPQTIHLSGLVDVDATDAHAGIALSADSLSTVDVDVAVHDHDKVAIATDLTGTTVTVNENGSAVIHVHLTHQPAGSVTVTLVPQPGPIMLSTTTLVFDHDNYLDPQTVTITGSDDANAVNETVALALQAPGLDEVDYTVNTIDGDALNIHATPTTLPITEGTNSGVSISLTAQPAATVHVTVAIAAGHVSVDATDLQFTTGNWATAQTLKITALDDLDTIDNADTVTLSLAGSTSVPISVTNVDNDVQQILTNAPNTVTIAESATASFGATLKYQPAANVTVAVASTNTGVATVSTGSLTFTPTNYNDPTMHQVTVTGTHDNNLATNAGSVTLSDATIGTTTVAVSVTDIDTQAYVLTATSLAIPEGQTDSFKVSLKYDPGTTQTVSITDTNATALPISPTSINFTGGAAGTWATPVAVTASPPIDSNSVGETAVFTVKGAAGATDATVMATVTDATVVAKYGWPAPPPFTDTELVAGGAVLAYKITIPTNTNLDAFGAYIPTAVGYAQMALYQDNGGVPGTLVSGTGGPTALATGANTLDISPDAAISVGGTTAFWIAIRFSQNTSISYSTSATGTACFRSVNIPSIDSPWPATFGTANCQTDFLANLWITTYHQ